MLLPQAMPSDVHPLQSKDQSDMTQYILTGPSTAGVLNISQV
jgi:hypothetical protein